jgi:hypothetical protein
LERSCKTCSLERYVVVFSITLVPLFPDRPKAAETLTAFGAASVPNGS